VVTTNGVNSKAHFAFNWTREKLRSVMARPYTREFVLQTRRKLNQSLGNGAYHPYLQIRRRQLRRQKTAVSALCRQSCYGFQFQKSRQLFIRAHNEPLFVATMRVGKEDCSRSGVHLRRRAVNISDLMAFRFVLAVLAVKMS
jgi:hypothetical protein